MMLGLRTKGSPPKEDCPKKVPFYTPAELGFNMPEVPYIFVGDCGGEINHYYCDPSQYFEVGNPYKYKASGGHTHLCPNDPFKSCICVSDDSVIIQQDGTPTDLIWHEYAHALDSSWGESWGKFPYRCIGKNLHEFTLLGKEEQDEFDRLQKTWNGGHHEKWRSIVAELGKLSVLNSAPMVRMSSQPAQAAAFIKSAPFV